MIKIHFILLLFLNSFTVLAGQLKLTQQETSLLTQRVMTVIQQHYLHQDKTSEIIEALRRPALDSSLALANDYHQIAAKLTTALRLASGDNYLEVFPSKQRLTLSNHDSTFVSTDALGYGFKQVEFIEANVGYIKLSHISTQSHAKSIMQAALTQLSGAEVLILDLSDVDSGSLSMAQHFISYFVQTNTHLAQLNFAKHIEPVSLYAEKLTGQAIPLTNSIVIVTSAFTQGSAEFIAYSLQKLKGALVIGEPTMGVSYWFDEVKLNEQLTLILPVASVKSASGNDSWQDNGVMPDKEIPVKDALAYVLSNIN